jgi:hypothetical protein
MKKLAIHAEGFPIVKQTADTITAGCANDTCRIAALYGWVKKHVRFRHDPPVQYRGELVEAEVLYRPEYLLEQITKQEVAEGDCDDSSTLLVALCLASGMRAGWIAVETGLYPGQLDHVYAIVFNRDIQAWRSIDVATTRTDWTGKRFIKTTLEPTMVTTVFGQGFAKPKNTFGSWVDTLITTSGGTLSNIFGKYQQGGGQYYPPSGYPYPVQAPSGGFSLGANSTMILALGGLLLVGLMMSGQRGRY